MNRTVWIARLVAVIILFVFTLLMLSLHSKLSSMQPESRKAKQVGSSRANN